MQHTVRCVVGLKGTMSEAELHLLQQRLRQGRLNKARRGALAVPLPVGYVRRPSGEVALDPDEQVQAVVRLIFRQFEELGTLNAVLRYLTRHQIQLGVRLREGPNRGDLVWRRPNRPTLQNLLHHPHIHFLVPGSGIAPDGQSWIACRPGFFLPVRVLSRMFRGLFLRYLEKAFAAGQPRFRPNLAFGRCGNT